MTNALPSTYAAGSDAPERPRVRVGFLPLVDCASLVVASAMGFDRRHGVELELTREASWAGVRDKLLTGRLDLAHVLYGLVYGVQMGIGGPQLDMAVLMTLNRNGQGLSLSRRMAARGAVDADSLAGLMRREPGEYTFAQTFPTGTHAMWLHYWLASAGIHPLHDVKSIVIPPPQMVDAARREQMDGFSVGEPWNLLGVREGVSVLAATSQDVWPDHPEKVLGCTARFADQNPNTCRAVIMAVLEASRWIDHSQANRAEAAALIAGVDYLGTAADALAEHMQGRSRDGRGQVRHHAHPLAFHADGDVNFPYLSDGMWFLTQHKRWGLLAEHPDYLAVAHRVQRIALYQEAADQLGIALPPSPLRSSRLIDGMVWDGSDPADYADRFHLQTPQPLARQAA